MEQLIKEVQALRTQLGLKPLNNPKKQGQAKLQAMLENLKANTKLVNEPKPSRETMDALKKAAATKALAVPTVEKKPKGKTIKEVSCELLSKVVGTTEEGRTLGMPYSDILARILSENPEAKTSLNCLRWYAGKIRIAADGYQMYTLPQIRLRPTKVEETEE